MPDSLDVPMEDSQLLDELHLMVDFIVACSESDAPLCQHRIDRILGLEASRDARNRDDGAWR